MNLYKTKHIKDKKKKLDAERDRQKERQINTKLKHANTPKVQKTNRKKIKDGKRRSYLSLLPSVCMLFLIQFVHL